MKDEAVEQRIQALEDRILKLERLLAEKPPLFVKKSNRCRWVKDASCPGGKFWLPACWGGVLGGKEGCYC